RVQKNQKNKPHKAAKEGHGKGKGKTGYASNNATSTPKPKTPPPPKKDNSAKDAICHQCGEVRHWRRNCPVYLAELIKKKKLSQGASTSGKGKTGYASNNATSTPKPKTPPPPKKDNPAKDAICHQCGEVRHWRRNCPVYLAELMKKKKLSQGASTSGKCVSCMFGKMARKPYSHQVEMAKDLLGLIHTDVFQKEVENQLRKTIKSLRSDCGERRNRTLLDMVRFMMSQTTLPESFWDYAFETAAHILNMVPTKKVDKTPYEIWHGQAPKLSYLKVRGCEAFVKRDILTKPDKLDPRSFKCIFVGYLKETMGYSFYSPYEKKIFFAQNLEYFEFKLLDLKASGSMEDLELIQEKDTNPFLGTSLNHEEDDQEFDEPQSDINPIPKSSRTHRAPDRMYLYIDAEEHELGDLDEPANYKAALLDPESKKWLDAINVEMQSMKDNDVWVLVELPPNARTIGSKWLFKKKTDMDDIRTIRILIAIAVYYDYEIWQKDVKTTFLNGHLFEEVYMEQPKGFVNLKYPNHIRKFISRLDIVPTIEERINMYCDNTGAITIAKDDEVTKGARHFRAKVHYLCETIKLGDVKIEKIDTDDNLADPFTKALAFPKHFELTRNIRLFPASSFM
nr:hypothetical protein [Tanacetum cinerariifolium]